jgi:hypothetical protein
VPSPGTKVLIQRQLLTIVGAMNKAVGQLVANSAAPPAMLTATERRHAEMLDYAQQLQSRLDNLGSEEGEALGLQRDTASFQSAAESLIQAIHEAMRGNAPRTSGLRGLLGSTDATYSPMWVYGLGAVASISVIGATWWWMTRRRHSPAI